MRRAVAAALTLLLGAGDVAAQTEHVMRPASGGGQVSTEVVSGQVFVKFAVGVNHAAAAAAMGGTIINEHPSIGWTLLQLPVGMTVAAGIGQFSGQNGVLQIDGNHVYHPTLTTNDPDVNSQYALSRIKAFTAWDTETGDGPGNVVIAIVDSGIDTTIADFTGKMAATNNVFFDPTSGAQTNPDPLNPPVALSHGTGVASVAAALGNNAAGIAGVAWGTSVKLVSLRIFNVGNGNTSDNAIIAATNYARTTLATAGLGRVVLNMSLGTTDQSPCSGPTLAALNLAVAAGIPIVISSGNQGKAVESPANCATSVSGTGIIPVGASDSTDNIASFSSRGPELAANGVCAPGVGVLTNDMAVAQGGTGGTVSFNGTSFSAPMVAGTAALMLSAKPALTVAQVQSYIRSSADNIGIAMAGVSSGGGRLDAARAINLAVNGTAGSADLDEKTFAYPNPFRPARDAQVTINIAKGQEGTSRTIKIYTLAGQFVRSVTGLTWDGKNDGGRLVASGVYMFSISLGDKVLNGRVAVIR